MTIGVTNGNGGTNLNFKVLGSLVRPVSARENTIWIKTDTPIRAWSFRPDAPTTPTDGMIWFVTGTSSPVGINALRKNKLMILPASAKQYVGGQWKDVETHTFIGGKWVPLLTDIVVFNSGDNTVITGGWRTGGYVDSFTADTQLYLHAKSGQSSGYAMTQNAIDLTNFSQIAFTCNSIGVDKDGRSKVYVAKSFGDNMVASAAVTKIGEYTIDVKSLTGPHYIGLFSKLNGIFSVNRIVVKI